MKDILGICLLFFTTIALSLAGPINVDSVINPGDACSFPEPEEAANQGLYAPHPTDCNQFLICDGTAYRAVSCNNGLHWNAEEEVCDWPANANCENGGTSNPIDPIDPTSPTTPTRPIDPTEETTWSPPTTPDGGWTSCPAIDPPGYTIHIQHPNCTLYYVCENGVAREQPCPPGLQWNNEAWACDWPNLANCVNGAAPEIPGAIPLLTADEIAA